ncbi:MAG: hypothetical protein V3T77_11415, partial [Planctomycetota bacterium]
LAIYLRASYLPGVRTDRPELVLAGVYQKEIPEGRAAVTVSLENSFQTELKVDGVHVMGSYLKSAMRRLNSRQVQLEAWIDPKHPAGRIHGKLHAQVNGLPLVVPIRGTVYQGIRTTPDYLNFSVIKSPEQAQQFVDLTAVDGREFKVLSASFQPSPSHEGLQVSIEVKPRKGGGYRIEARLLPPFPQGRSRLNGNVEIETDHPEKPKIVMQCFGILYPTPGKS